MIVIAIIIVVVIIVIIIDHKGNQAGKSLSLNVPAMPPKNRPGTNWDRFNPRSSMSIPNWRYWNHEGRCFLSLHTQKIAITGQIPTDSHKRLGQTGKHTITKKAASTGDRAHISHSMAWFWRRNIYRKISLEFPKIRFMIAKSGIAGWLKHVETQ